MSSRKKPVVKTVVTVETTKGIAQELDGVLRAIETGIVDVQTITTLKRLLAPKSTPSASVTVFTNTKQLSLASSRTKKATSRMASTAVAEEPFPSAELVSATKTVIMKSLTALATEAESRSKKTESTPEEKKSSKQPVSPGTRNVAVSCKLALESLRQWQDHIDIGSTWVNKAYLGYLGKLIALEMVPHISFRVTHSSLIQRLKNSPFLNQKSRNNSNYCHPSLNLPLQLQGENFKHR
jgi:hypothetical protein